MTEAARFAQQPRTATGRRILLQDYRGNESYTVTREDILAIENEAALPYEREIEHLAFEHGWNHGQRMLKDREGSRG